jgi:hypothetical protein
MKTKIQTKSEAQAEGKVCTSPLRGSQAYTDQTPVERPETSRVKSEDTPGGDFPSPLLCIMQAPSPTQVKWPMPASWPNPAHGLATRSRKTLSLKGENVEVTPQTGCWCSDQIRSPTMHALPPGQSTTVTYSREGSRAQARTLHHHPKETSSDRKTTCRNQNRPRKRHFRDHRQHTHPPRRLEGRLGGRAYAPR